MTVQSTTEHFHPWSVFLKAVLFIIKCNMTMTVVSAMRFTCISFKACFQTAEKKLTGVEYLSFKQILYLLHSRIILSPWRTWSLLPSSSSIKKNERIKAASANYIRSLSMCHTPCFTRSAPSISPSQILDHILSPATTIALLTVFLKSPLSPLTECLCISNFP